MLAALAIRHGSGARHSAGLCRERNKNAEEVRGARIAAQGEILSGMPHKTPKEHDGRGSFGAWRNISVMRLICAKRKAA